MKRRFWPVMVLSVLAVACGGDDAGGSADSDGVGAALAFIPADDVDQLQLSIDFLDNARAASWWGEPDDGVPYVFLTNRDHRFGMQAVIEVFGGREVFLYRYGEGFGYDVEDASIVVSSRVGADMTNVAIGDIDRNAIEQAITSDPAWSGELSTATTTGGTEYWQWGDDLRLDMGRMPGRPLGRGGQLFVDGSAAVRTVSTDRMEATLAANESGRNLAALDDIAALITRLEGEQMLTAYVTNDPPAYGGDLVLEQSAPVETTSEGLRPYRLLAVGTADGGDGPIGLAVLVHSSTDDAQENNRRLTEVVAEGLSVANNERWSDIVGAVEIEVDDVTLVARFDGENSGALFESILRGDSLFGIGDNG